MLRSALLSLALAPLLCAPARAEDLQKGCFASIKEAAADLSKRFGEAALGVGWSDRNQAFLAFFVGGATWTLVKVEADGSACYIDGGHSWREAPRGDPS